MSCSNHAHTYIQKYQDFAYMICSENKKEQTCKKSLQLFTLVGNDVVGGWDEGAAGTVDAQLQPKIILWSVKRRQRRYDQLMKMKFTNTVNDLLLLNLTWIWHPVLNGFGDLHRDPGSLRLQLNGAGINVTLSGDALFIWPQQLTRHIHRLKTWQWWSWHTDTQSPVGIVSKYFAFSVCYMVREFIFLNFLHNTWCTLKQLSSSDM